MRPSVADNVCIAHAMLPERPYGRPDEKEDIDMCLTCGCMDAHREMGENNITYDDIKRAADENGRSVEETLQIFQRTEDKDRQEHRQEYTTGASTSA